MGKAKGDLALFPAPCGLPMRVAQCPQAAIAPPEPLKETLKPGAPPVLGWRIELNADLCDLGALHVAHNQFHCAEARPVSDSWCSVEPAGHKLCEGHSAIGSR